MSDRRSATASPPIVVRNLSFGHDRAFDRWYMAGDPVSTSFFNALSATFPLGEKFFIDSVRPFRDAAPAPLCAQIADFIKQEALHTREHAAFNALMEAAGYDAAKLYANTRVEIDRMKRRSSMAQLGCTMALEHFTALFAHELLAVPRHLSCAPVEVRAMWRWHALEEIEHKAVAFDTFDVASRSWSPLRRWTFRAAILLEATLIFVRVVSRNLQSLHKQDRLPWLKTWMLTVGYLLGPRGVLTAMAPGWASWFRLGFHPWDRDDRALAAAAARDFDTPAVRPQRQIVGDETADRDLGRPAASCNMLLEA